MANTLNEITVSGDYKHLRIREITDSGDYHRRVLTCDMTLADDERQEVKDKAEAEWTDEVKSAWATFKAEQEAKYNTE
ncbi:uncharacterized protein METZ01_LOCUS303441 [marine metagenome]|uniref:Uncharacterized protein n=1 Tax=marine metagenome TaxID=408172 RepID=A0A382MS43_9ZZZZ